MKYFKKFLQKKKKIINFFDDFLYFDIFHESDVKNFLK